MRLVVVGADGAGMSAAHQALRTARRKGTELEVIALEESGHTSYSACGIPYWLAGDVPRGQEDLVVRTADQHRQAGIDLRLGMRADELDLADGSVLARDVATGAPERIRYDELVIATGAAPIVPSWSAVEGRSVLGVGVVKTLDDGAAWLRCLHDDVLPRRPRHGVVVGGGYIGVEMAEALLRAGLEVTLLTRGEVMGSLDPDMGARVREELVRAGVHVVCGAEIDGLEADASGQVTAVSWGGGGGSGGSVAADVVVLGTGVTPSTGFAEAAGLRVGRFGGLQPDDRQQVDDHVWAAGDCCEHVERFTGRRVFVPLATSANKQGRVAGENIAGGDARFEGVLGTAVTRFTYGDVHVEVGRTGQTIAAAEELDLDLVELVTESTTASHYMPESAPIAVKIIADRSNRRLIGVQIVGGPGAAKRIDAAAVMLWTAQTVDDVAGMDLSYAPPLSPVYDAVQIACRRLADRF